MYIFLVGGDLTNMDREAIDWAPPTSFGYVMMMIMILALLSAFDC